jgi:hypothetical protein
MGRNRIITHKIKRGSLIHFALDGIKRESFEVIKTELASLLKRRAGVYAITARKARLPHIDCGFFRSYRCSLRFWL